jgi:tetratricopeptide (TPR) repeat protein
MAIIKKTLLVGVLLSATLLSQPLLAKKVTSPSSDQNQSTNNNQMTKGENAQQAIRDLRNEWAHIKYNLPKNEKLPAFEALIKKAEKLSIERPQDATVALWHGTILSTYASVKGGMGALPYLKEARILLEKSISINPNIDMGLAHGVLGAIYYRIPGWPVAFGDKQKAKQHLEMALQIGPESIDNNYYYGDFLRDQGEYAQAKKFLITAEEIPPRQDRLAADKGRLTEIATALRKIEEKSR